MSTKQKSRARRKQHYVDVTLRLRVKAAMPSHARQMARYHAQAALGNYLLMDCVTLHEFEVLDVKTPKNLKASGA